MTILTGAWNNIPKNFDTFNDYIKSELGNKFENYVNEYIEKYKIPKKHFKWNPKTCKDIEQFVMKNWDSLYPDTNNAVFDYRLHNLCLDAVQATYID